MRKFVAATTTLVLAGIAGFGLTAASFALWFDETSFNGELSGGYIHFAAFDPDANPADLQGAITGPGQDVTWQLPAGDSSRAIPAGFSSDVLADLRDTGVAQAAIVQIDAQSQGNRGLQYRIADIDVSTTAAGANLSIAGIFVDSVGECSADMDTAGAAFSGTLASVAGTTFSYTPLVSADYSDATWQNPETDYLCLIFDIDAQPGEYENVASATAQVYLEALDTTFEVTAQDAWKVQVGAQLDTFDADIDFTFEYVTHRPGEAVGP